jgi:hypothetical protein
MKDEEFKKKLSEVADWRIPQTITGTKDGDAKKPRKVGRPSAEDLYQEAMEREFLEATGGVNPTFPPQVIKVKNQSCICEDCGQFCENGRHKEKKIYDSNGKKHWRERCITCQRCVDPYTGQYSLNGTQASIKWNSYMKEVGRRYEKSVIIQPEDSKDV